MANTKVKSFQANFDKLEKLSERLRDNQISIDELVPQMKEALGSIKVCKEVLKKTELQLEEINEEFEEISFEGDEEEEELE